MVIRGCTSSSEDRGCRGRGAYRVTPAVVFVLSLWATATEIAQETLGSREGLLDALPSTIEGENGHVARNVRLSLMLIDLVQPYVHWAPSTPLKAATVGSSFGCTHFRDLVASNP